MCIFAVKSFLFLFLRKKLDVKYSTKTASLFYLLICFLKSKIHDSFFKKLPDSIFHQYIDIYAYYKMPFL